MKARSKSIVILTILFGYILLQFVWWEILLVKQNGLIINEKQKLVELSSTNDFQLKSDIAALHHKKKMQTVMIVSEGTVFLLLLLFGVYKIKQSMDKEAALNNQQNNFFLSITHELKTPIAATKLQLQTLKKQNLEPEIQSQLITNALQETERLNNLIDNILLASRLESNEFNFKPEPINLSDLVSNIVTRYYQAEINKGLLSLNVQSGINVNIDNVTMPSVLTNLIDNAIKYSGDNRAIKVRLHKEKNMAVLCVEDNGTGITNEDKLKVFDKFYRVGSEETRRTKGTGLGLFIVKYIVRKHNGEIKVLDNKPTGSIFEVQFNLV